jgi:hypothetical protein
VSVTQLRVHRLKGDAVPTILRPGDQVPGEGWAVRMGDGSVYRDGVHIGRDAELREPDSDGVRTAEEVRDQQTYLELRYMPLDPRD